MIISHRGLGSNKKENTIEAFDFAIKNGADAIECDLQLTKDNKIFISHEKIKSRDGFLTIDELFDYIKIRKNISFFLEVKSKSSFLAQQVAKEIKRNNLWHRVYVLGFFVFIKASLLAQKNYPKLRVVQIINIPLFSYIKIPTKSYGVFIGWIDEWTGSQWLFRKLMSIKALTKLRKFYEKNGFKVMAGIINNKSGLEYFNKAGIKDIVTNNIAQAKEMLKE